MEETLKNHWRWSQKTELFGHTLNLAVQKAFALSEVHTAVTRAKKVVEYTNKYRHDVEKLEEK